MHNPSFEDYKDVFEAIKNYFEVFLVPDTRSNSTVGGGYNRELEKMRIEVKTYFEDPDSYSHRPQRLAEMVKLTKKYGIRNTYNNPTLDDKSQRLAASPLVQFIQKDVDNAVEFVLLRASDQASIMRSLRKNEQFMKLLKEHVQSDPTFLYAIALNSPQAANMLISCRIGFLIDNVQLAKLLVYHRDNLSGFRGRVNMKNLPQYIQSLSNVIHKSGRNIMGLLFDEKTKDILCGSARFKAYYDSLPLDEKLEQSANKEQSSSQNVRSTGTHGTQKK